MPQNPYAKIEQVYNEMMKRAKAKKKKVRIEQLENCPDCGGELKMETAWSPLEKDYVGTGDIICQKCGMWAEHGDYIEVPDYTKVKE